MNEVLNEPPPMITPAKRAANGEDADRRTDDESPVGHARHRRTHRLLRRDLVLPDESVEEFNVLAARLTRDLDPDDAVQRELASIIIGKVWRLRRVVRLQRGLFADRQLAHAAQQARHRAQALVRDPMAAMLHTGEIVDPAGHAVAMQAAAGFEAEREASPLPRLARTFTEHATAFATLSRDEAALEDGLFRALQELQRLQAARGRSTAPPLVDLVGARHHRFRTATRPRFAWGE